MRNKQRKPQSGSQGFSDLLSRAPEICVLILKFSFDSLLKFRLHRLHDGDLSIELELIVHYFGYETPLVFGKRSVSDCIDLSEATLAH